MRIAVILESGLHSGGGYQQELNVTLLLNKHQGQENEFIFYTMDKANLTALKAYGISAIYLRKYSLRNLAYLVFFRGWFARKALGAIKAPVSSFEKALLKERIDLVYFLKPSFLALLLTKMNYMITVWDLCHRDYPEFPEVNFEAEFEWREYIYTNVLKKAAAVLADSDLGRLNVIRRYGCDAERVYAAKFLPSAGINKKSDCDIRAKYLPKKPYIFYPAQFWPHKNHIYILEGLSRLKTKFDITLDVVFSGKDKGNLDYVLAYAGKLDLSDNVHCVGFVPDEELADFYREAVALVMPTYFGPTNIPPLEAFAMGCPVCYSDLPGLSEQVKDAAFLMDLNDPEILARHLETILNDPAAVCEKLKRGQKLLSQWTESDYWNILKNIFVNYSRKAKCWKNV